MSDVERVVVPDPEEAAEVVAGMLAEADGNVVLTGGSSPRRAYELAARRRRDWRGVTFWWGDERCVPPDDERSNYRLARETLLAGATGAAEHRIRGEAAAEAAAAEYHRALRGAHLGLVLLGLGPDGHVASLFPHAPALDETEKLAVAAEAGLEPLVPRVTMTLPALRSGELVVLLVTGEAKADAVRRALAEPPSPATPGSLVRGRRTLAVLDEAAASALPG